MGGINLRKKLQQSPKECKRRSEKATASLKEHFLTHDGNFTNKKHSMNSIEKMKQAKQNYGKGKENSQYGSMWITDGIINKKIKKKEIIPEGFEKGRNTKGLAH